MKWVKASVGNFRGNGVSVSCRVGGSGRTRQHASWWLGANRSAGVKQPPGSNGDTLNSDRWAAKLCLSRRHVLS